MNWPFAQALLHRLLLVLLDRGLGSLDQRQDVAHAEDPRRHPVGVEPLELVELLARRDELDRLARDGLDGERRAAARVAVELRQHDAVELDALLERLRDPDRLLAGHRVEHEQDVVGRASVRTAASSSISASSTWSRRPRCRRSRRRAARAARWRPFRGLDRIARSSVDRDVELPAELLELVDRGRALEVGRDEPGLLAFLAEQQGELRSGGRLPEPWRPASRITVGAPGERDARGAGAQ